MGNNIFQNKYPFVPILYKYGLGENMKGGKDVRGNNVENKKLKWLKKMIIEGIGSKGRKGNKIEGKGS